MPPLAYFFAGFIVGGVCVGVLVPLLFLWRADKPPDYSDVTSQELTYEMMEKFWSMYDPSVREQMSETPASGDPSSGVGGMEGGE